MASFLRWDSWLPWSCVFFTGLYLLGYWVVFARRWPRGAVDRFKVASCCMSIVHGTSTSMAAAIYMLNLFYTDKQQMSWSPTPSSNNSSTMKFWLASRLGVANTRFEEAIMEYSTAYFLVDLDHYLLFVPNQPLFVLHHVFTSSYMLSCRFYTGHGAFSTIILFVVAESTSSLQNVWTISLLTHSAKLFNLLNVPFLIIFSIFRGGLTPWATWQLCLYFLFSREASAVVPFPLALYSMWSVFMGISGILYWVSTHWAKLMSKKKSEIMRASASKTQLQTNIPKKHA
ncbi:hypothetical protein KP509_14G016500 [Ceratopteris richardii]|uniref:TLC domain-containing protein n=1 Tax=Ceratopteris richardii TaxID=49495 RepID=A0A8T2TCL1_CERRI|nr:hypothetical protein KP509_14G016500 [Ceratopteris richardii]